MNHKQLVEWLKQNNSCYAATQYILDNKYTLRRALKKTDRPNWIWFFVWKESTKEEAIALLEKVFKQFPEVAKDHQVETSGIKMWLAGCTFSGWENSTELCNFMLQNLPYSVKVKYFLPRMSNKKLLEWCWDNHACIDATRWIRNNKLNFQQAFGQVENPQWLWHFIFYTFTKEVKATILKQVLEKIPDLAREYNYPDYPAGEWDFSCMFALNTKKPYTKELVQTLKENFPVGV